MRTSQVYTGVKVVDAELEFDGKVGTVIGDGDEEGTVKVRFDDGQVFDFKQTSLQGL
jgi:hypothetical protein